MATNSINLPSSENKNHRSPDAVDHSIPVPTSEAFSRRAFIGKAGMVTAAGVLAPVLPASAFADKPSNDDQPKDLAGQDLSERYHSDRFQTLHAGQLRRKAFVARIRAAQEEYSVDIPPQPNNGDEARYPDKISVGTKGLKHDPEGHVDPVSYASLLKALKSGKHEDFEDIILGGTTKLADPEGPLTTALEGISNAQLAIPLAARLDSAELAADHIEVYWQALLRDVSFSDYRNDTANPLVLAAVKELNRLAAFNGPRAYGHVTPETLFRSTALYVDYEADAGGTKGKYVIPPGTLEGPYISQFLLKLVPAWGLSPACPKLVPYKRREKPLVLTFVNG